MQSPPPTSRHAFFELPDPGGSGSVDELVDQLRRLKIWAGNPSYESIKDRVNAAWTAAGRPAAELAGKSTVADCFRHGRRRLNTDLVLAVVEALHPDTRQVARWREALRMIGGLATPELPIQVQVSDNLPSEMPGFTGRADELGQIRQAVRRDQRVVVLSGMAGIGKTHLAVRAGHLLAGEQRFDRVFFVNLRGFHTDSSQPPVDPAATLDAFLRLLGSPAQHVPRDVATRAAAYRARLTGVRALVVLDNAADEDQVRSLVADSPGCLTLVTSRRRLTGLPDSTQLDVGTFSPVEAEHFLQQVAPAVPVGPDPRALTRIAQRCGHLPLALGLVAGHIGGRPGWTLTDHADRLDERHRARRLDTVVEVAFDVSYRQLPSAEQRLLRLLALHPGQDFDPYAAAALTATTRTAVRRGLRRLSVDNLVQTTSPDRYCFHDLIHAYALGRCTDDEAVATQRAALTRLFDHYVANAGRAMDVLHPTEAARRAPVAAPTTDAPDLTDQESARSWLMTERPTFVAVSTYAVAHDLPSYALTLSSVLYRFLTGVHHADALIVHGNAYEAAAHTDDEAALAHALTNVGVAYGQMNRTATAAEHFERALDVFTRLDDLAGQARALGNLGALEEQRGRYRSGADFSQRAVLIARRLGDLSGEARWLSNLGNYDLRLGHYESARDNLHRSLMLCARNGNQVVEARSLSILGAVETRVGELDAAADHLDHAIRQLRKLGDLVGEGWTLNRIGTLNRRLGELSIADSRHHDALMIFRRTGIYDGEIEALNSLGYIATATGRPGDAVTHHQAALRIVTRIDDRYGRAMALAGLGAARQALGDADQADRYLRQALTLRRDLGVPAADAIDTELATVDRAGPAVRDHPG